MVKENKEKKNVFITGGCKGIGKAIAEKFAQNGYNLILNYNSSKTDTEAIQKEFAKYNIQILFEQGDVSNFDKCEEMVEKAIEKFGKIDTLVNNAGITKDGLLLRMQEEDFDKVIAINLKGTFNMTKAATKYMMKKREGRIVSLSSVVGVAGNAGQANYAASKAGIIGFTKSVAKELGARNILANCVAPGFIDTDMTKVLSDKVKENINSQIPLKRMGTPCDVAKLVYFLGSSENTYITGQTVNIDGGMI